jgi:hypothetical protein
MSLKTAYLEWEKEWLFKTMFGPRVHLLWSPFRMLAGVAMLPVYLWRRR